MLCPGPRASHLQGDGEESLLTPWEEGGGKGSEIQKLQSLPAFEESHVKDGCVGIHELQQESLEDQPLLEALLCLWNL